MESKTAERDEKSNKDDFFYRLGTQTGMTDQKIQEDASSVEYSIIGLIRHGSFRSVKYSLTGFVKWKKVDLVFSLSKKLK